MDSEWVPADTLPPVTSVTGVTFDAVLDGSIRIVEMRRDGMTCQLTVCRQARPDRGGLLTLRERSVVRRLALGQCQKLVAYDFGLAHTTVSSHLRGALDKLGLARWEHAVLVAAVFEARGARTVRIADEDEGGSHGGPGTERHIVVECELAQRALLSLTEAERNVALWVVDGCANSEVGRRRRCSSRTVANQISSVFRKLHVHGRCELIRLLVLTSEVTEYVVAPADTAPQSDRRIAGTSPDSAQRLETASSTLPAQAG